LAAKLGGLPQAALTHFALACGRLAKTTDARTGLWALIYRK